jgi:steroid delta-isomerase-like uncharacterized protein
MSAENVTLVRRWFTEVWNDGRSETIDELLHKDAVLHGLGQAGLEVRGPDNFKQFHHTMRGAYPDVRITLEDIIDSGDKVVARFHATATHKGDHLGIKATNNPVEFDGISVARIEDGKIAEGWNSWDQLGMLYQIDAIEPPQLAFLTQAA